MQAQEDQQKAKKARQDEEIAVNRQFREDCKTLFAEVIKPAIVDILVTLKDSGIRADYGQLVYPVTYAGNTGCISISIPYKKSVIQMDIVGIVVGRRIEVKFYFKPKEEKRITYALSIAEVNREKIEEVLQAQLERA